MLENFVIFKSDFLDSEKSTEYMNILLTELELKRELMCFGGKTFLSNRQIDFRSDSGLSYYYSGIRKHGKPWTPILSEIKESVEKYLGESFNAVLCNYYPDGNTSLGWHTDAEPDLEDDPIIASVSLGAGRDFQIKTIGDYMTRPVSLFLNTGSLVVMKRGFQTRYLHCVPKRTKIKEPRLNLTFRIMKKQ